MMPQHPAAKTFVWFVLFCLLVELGFRWLVPMDNTSRASEHNRNETQLRNWPEYLSGDQNGDNLLVYLGNSQAIGPEIANHTLIYPAIMREALARSRPQLEMENWSVSGLTAEQIELLVLQAEQRGARYLVMAVSMLNFDSLRNYRYGRDRTDIHLLTGQPAFWPELENSFVGNYVDWDDRLAAFFKLHTRWGRTRIMFFDYLAQQLDRRWQRVALGHMRSSVAGKRIDQLASPEGPDQNAPIQKVSNNMSPEAWEKSMRLERVPRLNVVYEHLRKRLHDSNIQLIWLWVPVGSNLYNEGAIEGQAPIIDAFCAQVEIEGGRCQNLSTALAPEYFLPSTFSSHLNLKGHQAQAELITPILERVIH